RSVGNNARMKKGAAKVTEYASTARTRCPKGGRRAAAVPSMAPMNGPVHVKLVMVNVRAMNKAPTYPPCPSYADVKRARPRGNSISYMPKRLRANSAITAPRTRLNQGLIDH